MLDAIIRLSVLRRSWVLVASLLLTLAGILVVPRLPVDVLPELQRPVVTVLVEAPGFSSEEVDTSVVVPLERHLGGLPGLETIRSRAQAGLATTTLGFAWGTEPFRNRQWVADRLAEASRRFPAGVDARIGPFVSLLGEVQLLSLTSEEGDPMLLRDAADRWVQPRLLTVPGVAQVTVIGGLLRQVTVQPDPARMVRQGIGLDRLVEAVQRADGVAPGGNLPGPDQEILVQQRGRIQELGDLAGSPVLWRPEGVLRLDQVARVAFGHAVPRGTGSVSGRPAVILAVSKQPGVNTIDLLQRLDEAVHEVMLSLPPGFVLDTDVFRQDRFIRAAVHHVVTALRDGSLLVVVVLGIFLANFRTTLISLSALPLSFLMSLLALRLLDLPINTMTLGGLAIAVGELVDDAIVDVENIWRRLREAPEGTSPLYVVVEASREVRGAIVQATMVVVIVMAPLFALGGLEGRLFIPLGQAYILSILASLIVSLTLTPAMSAWLLPRQARERPHDGWLLQRLHAVNDRIQARVLEHPRKVVSLTLLSGLVAVATVPALGREFLPPFREGSWTVALVAQPGMSLEASDRLGLAAERVLAAHPAVLRVSRRTGRAEGDSHAEGLHFSELDVQIRPDHLQDPDLANQLRGRLAGMPGVGFSLGQPIGHRLDHLLSGVRAPVAIKISGPDGRQLPSLARQAARLASGVPGLVDVRIEAGNEVAIEDVVVDRVRAGAWGIGAREVSQQAAVALAGRKVAEWRDGLLIRDVVVRADPAGMSVPGALAAWPIQGPDGVLRPLSGVASLSRRVGPEAIHREARQQVVIVTAAFADRDQERASKLLEERLQRNLVLPEGHVVAVEGQWKTQREATVRVGLLALVSLGLVFGVLWMHFRSATLAGLVLAALPLALVGAVAAIWASGGILSVASLIGAVTLTGIAARNSVLLLEQFAAAGDGPEGPRPVTLEMLREGSRVRLGPVLMTATTAGLGLLPLAFGGHVPGQEILQPLATVILGGLVSSTVLNVLVFPAMVAWLGRDALLRSATRRREARTEAAGLVA